MASGLQSLNASQVGGHNADISASDLCLFGINLGSHIIGSETVYVTVTTTAAISSCTVAGLVNEPVPSMPLKINQYSDSSFADQNTLQAYIFDPAGGSLIGSTDSVEIRNMSFSQTNTVQTYVIANSSDGFIDQEDNRTFGKLMQSQVPLSTTFNKTGVLPILCVSAMDNSPQDRAIAQRQAQAVQSVLSPSERRAQ